MIYDIGHVLHLKKSKETAPTIGDVASFDEISEIITELFHEWKNKEKVKSQVLKALVTKMSKDDIGR